MEEDNKAYEELIDNDFVEILKSNTAPRYSQYFIHKENSYDIYITDRLVTGTVQLYLNNKINRRIFIKNCVFEYNLCISQGEFSYISFENVTFNFGLLINGGLFNGDILIDNCNFTGHTAIYDAVFKNDISIEKSIFENDFTIGSGNFNKSVKIEKSTFKRNIIIKNGIFEDKVSFIRNKILDSFIISNGTFNKDFNINNEIIRGDFSVSDGIFKGDIISSGEEYQREFLIEGGDFYGKIILNSGNYNQVRCSSEKHINLKINERCTIITLKFNTIISKDTFIQMYGGVSSLIFDHTTNLGTIQFIGLFCYKLEDITRWIEKSKKEENDLIYTYYVNKELSTVSINNSDLGKVSFISCDLTDFALVFKSSKMTEVFISGTKMPEKIFSYSEEQKQLGYSQIKKIYESRGDKVTANLFLSKEMNAYYSNLTWCGNIGEKLNLLANKISTNHGQSWIRGFWTTIVVGAIFFILYCWQLGIRPVWPIKEGELLDGPVDCFWEVTSYFLEFINPIHKADYIAEKLFNTDKTISSSARAVEGVSRVFIAYFAYQLIQAFRKHGK